MNKLVVFTALLCSVPAYAGLITHTDYTAGVAITASGQNANENIIVNEINGNIESANIKDATIASVDISAGGVAVSNLVTAAQYALVPTGALFPYAGSSAPSGYLLCNGQAVSRSTYSDLYAIISTTYGTGDGATTFNVPNLSSSTAVGKASTSGSFNTLGLTGGATSFSVTIATITTSSNGAHTHSLNSGTSFAGWGCTTGNEIGYCSADSSARTLFRKDAGADSFIQLKGVTDSQGAHTHTVNGTVDRANNMPPFVVVNYIIKT